MDEEIIGGDALPHAVHRRETTDEILLKQDTLRGVMSPSRQKPAPPSEMVEAIALRPRMLYGGHGARRDWER